MGNRSRPCKNLANVGGLEEAVCHWIVSVDVVHAVRQHGQPFAWVLYSVCVCESACVGAVRECLCGTVEEH